MEGTGRASLDALTTMADDQGSEVSTDGSAVDRSALATEVATSYAQDSLTQSGASGTTIGLLKQYVDTYLQQNGVDFPPASTDNAYLVSAIESELGLASSDAVLGPLIASQIEAFAVGKQVASISPAVSNVTIGADPIEMFSGQFTQQVTDLVIPGAGMDFAFWRVYKNQAIYFGPLGANWDHCYNLRIRQSGANLIRSTGELRDDLYTRHPLFGQAGFSYWVPPDGQHGIIEENGQSFSWRSPTGVRHVYEADPSDQAFHRLASIRDRFGNYLAFSYTDGQLGRVEINNPARYVTFEYDTCSRISIMRDHSGRRWTYEYDDYGDLVSVTSPATDRYPAGLSAQYYYSSSDSGPPLQHNLLQIIDPAGQLYLENEYGLDPGYLNFNRVVRQRQGDGESFFEYEQVVDDFDFTYQESEKPAIQVNQVLRNGQLVHSIYNKSGNMLLREECVMQEGRLSLAQWRYRFNRDGSLTGMITPEGCVTQYYYGRDDYLSVYGITDEDVATDSNLSSALRMGFGNLLAVVRRGKRYDLAAMDLSVGVWGDFFPDIVAAIDVHDIIVKNTYEADYQQVLTTSDPRFTASPDPRYAEGPGYDQHLTRYEYSSPPLRTLTRIRYPDTTFPAPLPDGTTGLAGNSTEYLSYDAHGRLRQVRDPEGSISEYQYFPAAPGSVKEGYLLAAIRDAGGLSLTTTFEYNDAGAATHVTNPRGVTTTFVVNELGQTVERISGGPGFHTRSAYDENGLLQRWERDNLNDAGQPSAAGNEVRTYKYDDQDNLVRETHGGADLTRHHVVRHRYDCADCRVATIWPAGNRIRIDYDERMLVKALTRGAGSGLASTARTTYDLDGRVTGQIDGRGFPALYRYDAFGRVTATTDALGNVRQRQYDKSGNVTVSRFFERRAGGEYYLLERSEFGYDERGSRTTQTAFLFETPILTADIGQDPDLEFVAAQAQGAVTALVTQFFYDRNGRLFRQVNCRGQEAKWEYDGAGRRVRELDHLGNHTETFYDENSNITRVDRHEVRLQPVTGAVLGEEVFTAIHGYDLLDRRTTSTDGLGNQTVRTYDSRDNLASVTDPLGNVRRYQYDVYNRKTADIAEMTSTGRGGGPPLPDIATQYGYDDNDRLASFTDANGSVTTFNFDELNRQFQTIYADGSSAEVAYDPADNITARRDNNGLRAIYQVDPLGRRTRVDLDTTALNAQFPYPPGSETHEQCSYDGLGRAIQRTNDFCDLATDFDSLGRAYAERIRFTSPYPAPTGVLELRRAHDGLSNPTDITYPSGRAIHYDYDGLNRVERITNVTPGPGYPGSAAMPAQYDIASYDFRGLRIGKATYGNQTSCEFTYDGAARVIGIQHATAGVPFLEIQQLFDGSDNRRVQADIPAPANHLNGEMYSLDSLYRLTAAARNPLAAINLTPLGPPTAPVAGAALTGQQAIDGIIGALPQGTQGLNYQYDPLGNRELEQRPGQTPVAYSPNELNQYQSVAGTQFRYDQNGNLIDDGQLRYSYNYKNQIAQIIDKATGTEILRLSYDSTGRTIMVREAGTATFLVNDGMRVVEEYTSGSVTTQYVYEGGIDERCQLASGGAEWWYHRDLLSSSRVLSDASGQPLATRYEYEPFGSPTATPATYNPYLFAGKRFYADAKVYDSRARQYVPRLGRFLQRDPLGLADGPNLYTYAANNPLAFVDVLGTEKSTAGAQIPQPAPRPGTMEYFLANRPSDPSPTSGLAGIKARLGVPAAPEPTPEWRQFQAPRTEALSPLERDVEELKVSIYAIGVMLKTYFEIADYVTKPAQVMMVVPGAVEVAGSLSLEEAAAFEQEAARTTTWSRTANTLQDEMALQAAKEGAGETIIPELGDPRYQRMEKVSTVVKSAEGRVTEVHYVQDKAGRGTWDPGGPPGREDFKFKRHSDDDVTRFERQLDPRTGPGVPPPDFPLPP